MATTIALDGKYQAISSEPGQKAPVLLHLYGILESQLSDARTNSKQALQNIADLPEGFDKCADIISVNIEILDEVFNFRAVKPLVRLLPKLNSYSTPPILDSTRLEDY